MSRNIVEDIANVELRPTFVGLVDDTGMGQDVIDKLRNHKVNTQFIRRVKDGMGTWLAVFNNDGDVCASISKRPDTTPLTALLKEQGDEIFKDCDSIALELDLEKETVKQVLRFAKKYNKRVYAAISNMSIAMERRDFLQQVDCFVCNQQEAGLLFSDDYDHLSPAAMREVLAANVHSANIPCMVVTMGGQGAVYARANGESGVVPAKKVDVIDTTGAGDAFFAGTVIGLTYGKNLPASCEIGSRLAASVICITGKMSAPASAPLSSGWISRWWIERTSKKGTACAPRRLFCGVRKMDGLQPAFSPSGSGTGRSRHSAAHPPLWRWGRQADHGQAGVGLDAHNVGHGQADEQGLEQALRHDENGLAATVEIADHTEQDRGEDGLQRKALEVGIAVGDHRCIRGEEAAEQVALAQDQRKDEQAKEQTDADAGAQGLPGALMLACADVLGDEGSHGLHQGAGDQHGEIDDLAGHAVAGGSLQTQAVDKGTKGQKRELGQKLLQRQRQADGQKLFALEVQPEVRLSDGKGRSFFSSMITAQTTLTACAATVAMAAPTASRWNPATRTRSPMMLTTQATSTKIREIGCRPGRGRGPRAYCRPR